MTMNDILRSKPIIPSLPNYVDTEHLDIEKFKLDRTVKLINDAGIGLECTIMTRTKALLIYHHFKICVPETEYEPYTIAAACLNLSIKFHEEKISLERVILLLYRMIDDGQNLRSQKESFISTLEAVKKMEIIILRMLEFDLNHTIAHQFLVYFMNDLQEELSFSGIWDVFVEQCTRLASDFYLSSKCISYKADEIAITVIKVSLYMMGIKNSYFNLRLQVINNIPEDKMETIIEDILSICYMGPRAERGEMKVQ